LACFCAFSGIGQAADFTVNGTTSTLTTIAPSLASPLTHHVKFTGAGYSSPGNLTLTGSTADTIFFERSVDDTSVVEVTGKLLKFEGLSSTTTILRGLAFHLRTADAALIDRAGSSPNHRLIIEDCVLFSDSLLNSTFLSWLGEAGSAIEMRRTQIVLPKNGANAKMDIQADSVRFINNLLNFEGVIGISTDNLLTLSNNTVNQVQFNLIDNANSVAKWTRNYFANPPTANHLTGVSGGRYVVKVLGLFGAIGSDISDNIRYTNWDGYVYPTSNTLFASSTTLVGTKADTVLWDWQLPGEATRGAWNGSDKLPAFNLLPKRTSLSASLNTNNGVVNVKAARIPREVKLELGTDVPYASITDSTRTLWDRDTTVIVTGMVEVTGLTFPEKTALGRPMLFTANAANAGFTAGNMGSEGSLTFANASPSARAFIPAFAGQNLQKGSDVEVKGIVGDTSVTVASVTRTGRMTFAATDTVVLGARYRPILRNGKAFGLKYTTNASGGGDVTVLLGKTGITAPFVNDSLKAYAGSTQRNFQDSNGKYLVTLPFASSASFRIFEKLAIGRGKDSIDFKVFKISTVSVQGHQLKVDSNLTLTGLNAPTLAKISKGISFQWPGRAAGDTFKLTLTKTDAQQKAYTRNGDSASLLTATSNGDASITVALGVGDNDQVIFLARPYPIAASPSQQSITRGEDQISELITSTPGEMSLDTNVDLSGLKIDSSDSQTWKFRARRRIQTDNLTIPAEYKAAIKGTGPVSANEVVGYILAEGAWTQAESKPTYSNGLWTIKLLAKTQAFAIGEWIPKPPKIEFESSAGDDAVENLTSTVSGKMVLSDSVNIESLKAANDTLEFIAKRRINVGSLSIQEPYVLKIAGDPPSNGDKVQGWIWADDVWEKASAAPTYADGKWVIEVPKNAKGLAISLRKPKDPPLDTIIEFSSTFGKDAVFGLISATSGTMSLDETLKTDTLKNGNGAVGILARRRIVVKDLKIQESYSLDLEGKAPKDTAHVLVWIRVESTWTEHPLIHPTFADSLWRILVPKDADGLAIGEWFEDSDSVPVDINDSLTAQDSVLVIATQSPSAEVKDNSLVIHPNLTNEEIAKTTEYVAKVWFVDAKGEITSKDTLLVTNLGSGAAFDMPPGVIGGYRIDLYNKAGLPAPGKLYTTPVDEAFIAAVNQDAPHYQGLIWELIGFPQDRPVTDFLGLFPEAKLKPSLAEWNGEAWKGISEGQMKKGRGYLLGIPEGWQPKLSGQNFPLVDSLVLEKGWQVISSPLPIPVADEDLQLTKEDIGFFQGLSWQGEGKDAQPNWRQIDTLKPFQGYAVWVAKKTTVRFGPKIPAGGEPSEAAGKRASTAPLRLNFTDARRGYVAQLLLGSSGRAASGTFPLFRPGFRAAWNKPDGSILSGRGKQTTFYLHSDQRAEVVLPMTTGMQGQTTLAIWSGRDKRLAPLGRETLILDAGWNAFQLIEAEPSQWGAIEAALAKREKTRWVLHSAKFQPGDKALRLQIELPTSQGVSDVLAVALHDVRGRIFYRGKLTGAKPGVNDFRLRLNEFQTGMTFLSITDDQNRVQFHQPFFLMGGQ